MANYQEEFNRLWGDVGCSVSGWDWNKPMPFDGNDKNSCYANEAAMLSSMTSEAYNLYGFEVDYYIKQISTKRDRLLGEDPLENILRRFRLSIYAPNVPNLQKQYQLQGMLYEEVFEVQATIVHFKEASRYDYDRTRVEYEEYEPKIGDLMYFRFSDKYYEVINVKKFAENTAFLSTPITYTFTLRIWHNSHEDVDIRNENPDEMPIEKFAALAESFDIENDTGEPVGSKTVASNSDILSINDFVSDKDTINPFKPDEVLQVKNSDTNIFKYQPAGEEKNKNEVFDPFDGWD